MCVLGGRLLRVLMVSRGESCEAVGLVFRQFCDTVAASSDAHLLLLTW